MRVLSNEDVRNVLGMKETMAALRIAYDELHTGEATYGPRIDYYLPTSFPSSYYQWGSMVGASRHFGVVAVRMKSDIASWPEGRTQEKYCLRPGLYCGLIMLFDASTGVPAALIQDGYLQHMRVGGAAGIGTNLLARQGPQAIGILGSGGMARTFLEAFAAVRPIREVRVYSPTADHREAYAIEMSGALGVPVKPVADAESAVRGAGIVASATDAMHPTFDPAWLSPGAHVVCVTRREISDALVKRADRIVQLGIHTVPYSTPVPMMEWKAGGIAAYVAGRPEERAVIPPSRAPETGQYPTLTDVEAGRAQGRTCPEDVTLFVGTGTQGLQFAAVGGQVLRLAAGQRLGHDVPDDWLLEDIRDLGPDSFRSRSRRYSFSEPGLGSVDAAARTARRSPVTENAGAGSRVPPGMLIERDVEVPMPDGLTLRADVFRPDAAQAVPVILTMGPYGKGLPYREAHFAPMWQWLISNHPEVLDSSSGEFMTWETVDPERWVPAGYAVVRVDSRGAGRSPGIMDIWSPQETQDLYDCIEWAGTQPWSSGKVGLCGISYYAMNQWWVAGLQPPHLAAMIPWEGANDYYREISHHGGILSNEFFGKSWYERQCLSLQHGKPGLRDPWLNDSVTGPEVFTEEELRRRRADTPAENRGHPLDGDWHRARSAHFGKIRTPLLSAANWAGFGLHERGNFEGFTESASEDKWLEVHPGRHEEWFYLPYGVDLQMRFMDYFLKGKDNGWDREPRVQLQIRYPDKRFELRKEHEWPLARTRWTAAYLDASRGKLAWEPPADPAEVSFEALGEPAVFWSDPLGQETEITGPLAALLAISASTTDADLFLTLQAFSPDGAEVDFQGTVDPHTPLAQGWLRASHRKLDPARSRPWRPYHPHGEIEPLTPGEVYDVDVEIWPTCIVLPTGYRLALVIGGRDFERPGSDDSGSVFPARGSGPWLHTDPADRPAGVFGGTTTIYSGNGHDSRLLIPVIPR